MLQLLPLLSGMNEECSALEEARRFGRVGEDVRRTKLGTWNFLPPWQRDAPGCWLGDDFSCIESWKTGGKSRIRFGNDD